MPPQTNTVVRQVESRRDLEKFVRLPWSLYADDSAWIPPLRSLIRDRLSARKNPYFRHADVAYFLAERSGEVVGRISVQVCQLVQKFHGDGIGHFGLFECENRPPTARALFDVAEQWLRHKGMSRMLGPFDLSINDEVGMLVEGFDHPPFVMMGHHHRYYRELMNDVGLQKEMDLFAYDLDISRPYTDRIQRIVERVSRDSRIVTRPVDKKDHDRAMRQALDVFKDGWADNWGYVPPTNDEVDHLVSQIRVLLDRGLVMLSEFEGELAGFMIVLPNLNEFTGDLNGRLLPIGWLRLLWRLRFAPFQSVRVPLMGLRKKFQGNRVGASIALSMIDQCRAKLLPQGVTHCEMSWILESNSPMRSILDASGSDPYKRYRVFSKTLCPDS